MTEQTKRLRAAAGRDLRTLVVASVAAAAVAGPSAYAAAYVANADKVDNKHAVGARATVEARKGKLVATNPRTGQLPANIVGKVGDSDRLDGRDASSFLGADAKAADADLLDGRDAGALVPRQVSASFGDPDAEPLPTLAGTPQPLGEVTITVPGPGEIRVDALTVVMAAPNLAGHFAALSISTDPVVHDPVPTRHSLWDVPGYDAVDDGLLRSTVPSTRTFTTGQAGTYTFYVVGTGSGQQPGDDPLVHHGQVTAQWFAAP